MSPDRSELEELARFVWGTVSENDAATLNRPDHLIGQGELDVRLRALGMQVIKGDIDAPSPSSWLDGQRPGRGLIRKSHALPGAF